MPHGANDAGWGSPERSIGGSDGVPTVSEREGEAEPDWSPPRGRREISEGYPRTRTTARGVASRGTRGHGEPEPKARVGSSREPCGAKGIPSLRRRKRAA